MRRRTKAPWPEPNNTWLITFADLCTLLLTFFVLIVSMSSLNHRALRATFVNFTHSSGILNYRHLDRIAKEKDMIIKEICKSLESVHQLDIRDIDEIPPEEMADSDFNLLVSSGTGVWLRRNMTDRTFSMIFANKLLFEKGSAELAPAARDILKTIGDAVADVDYRITIDGHTDATPIRSGLYRSNAALSLARAQSVLELFLNSCAMLPERLAIGGYGSSQPLEKAASPERQALNRRVELIFEKIPENTGGEP